MNAGYSAGWCEESFGFPLIASEILCRARGDDCCRFVMAPPDRLVSVVEQYVSKTAELKNAVPLQATQELVGRKLLEDQLREARDELEQRVAVRTAELESANRQLEREILGREAVERRLLQAQKLDALGRLAGGIAHDFNNLLTIINGCAELLQDASKAERAELIADISGAGERAKQLTEQLLVFSKQQVSESDTIDLCRVVDAMSSMLRRLIREDIQLERNICPGPLWVRCNSSQLEQVVVNLTVNARDAMPQGGTLWVDVETQEYDGVDHAMLRVRDTGSGMDKTVLDKIFDPFFSTKERTKGTGLGLSTVYGIIERAGGRVEVDSTLGEGTTVQVRLPIAPSKPAPIAPTVRPISEGALNRAILLVEDEPDVRKLIEKSLLRKGLRVLAAKNAQEAHSLFQSHRDEIQLLLSDVIMPGQSGVELCRELRKEKPELKAVFISGYADHELGDLDLDENATQFLQKPLRLAELHLRIAALLDFSR
jgi:signal transduction histidine kinase